MYRTGEDNVRGLAGGTLNSTSTAPHTNTVRLFFVNWHQLNRARTPFTSKPSHRQIRVTVSLGDDHVYITHSRAFRSCSPNHQPLWLSNCSHSLSTCSNQQHLTTDNELADVDDEAIDFVAEFLGALVLSTSICGCVLVVCVRKETTVRLHIRTFSRPVRLEVAPLRDGPIGHARQHYTVLCCLPIDQSLLLAWSDICVCDPYRYTNSRT